MAVQQLGVDRHYPRAHPHYHENRSKDLRFLSSWCLQTQYASCQKVLHTWPARDREAAAPKGPLRELELRRLSCATFTDYIARTGWQQNLVQLPAYGGEIPFLGVTASTIQLFRKLAHRACSAWWRARCGLKYCLSFCSRSHVRKLFSKSLQFNQESLPLLQVAVCAAYFCCFLQ